MITTTTLDGSPEAVLDRLIDEIRVEWSRHPHVTQWVLRTASRNGLATSELVELAALMSVREAQLRGIPLSDEATLQRSALRVAMALAEDPEVWAAWTASISGELDDVLAARLTSAA